MKPTAFHSLRLRATTLTAVTVVMTLTPTLHAASGTWNVDASGLWSNTGNWLTNDLTADRVVSLAGLTYTVQFSADLTSPWVASATTPTLVTGDPSSGDIEAVRVPFPGLIDTVSGPKQATFFRVQVSQAP